MVEILKRYYALIGTILAIVENPDSSPEQIAVAENAYMRSLAAIARLHAAEVEKAA